MYQIPELPVSERFPTIPPLLEARGHEPGRPPGQVLPGIALAALKEAVPDFRARIIESGRPTGVTTCDLITLPYPTRFGLWRAAISPAPFLWITNRMLVVQWVDPDGTPRTLLWEASDHERGEYTPYFARLRARSPLPDWVLTSVHGTVLGHLRVLGIDPADVDYLAFDHLHTQDVRRLVGTTRPAPDLGSPSSPVEPWFPNATLITQVREWEAIRHLHPLQAPWYQPETYLDLPHDRLLVVDGDVLLGPGVALMESPGHTAGNMSLVLHTDRGLWTSSENGVAAECWAPETSRIPGVRRWSAEWGQKVILNANTIEFAAWQYDSMIVESMVADPAEGGPFPQCFPSSELTPNRLAPGVGPTFRHHRIEHGDVHGGRVVRELSA